MQLYKLHLLNAFPLFLFLSYSNGHTCRLNTTSSFTGAKSFLQDLSESGWFDTSTRLVTVDFTLYSADVNVFVYVRMIVEQAATGGIGKYSSEGAASEGAAREWSTVVDISIKPPSFKLVPLSSPRSPLSKTPKHVIF